MKNKIKSPFQEFYSNQSDQPYISDQSYMNRPVKSPSPDKKASNIITSTRSPQIAQIKRQLTPIKNIRGGKNMTSSEIRQRQFPLHSTPRKQNQYNSQMQFSKMEENTHQKEGTNKKHIQVQGTQAKYYSPKSNKSINLKIEVMSQYTPEQFQKRQQTSSRVKQSGSSQLDYIKMIRSKDQTIRDLQQIIQMIKRNSDQENIQDDSLIINSKRNNQSNNPNQALLIENQKLLSIIEKNQIGNHLNKQDLLKRQIRELKDSLKKNQQYYQEVVNNFNKKIENERKIIRDLQNQNDKLIKMMREKEGQDKSRDDSIVNSVHSQLNKSSGEKQKLLLIKIKEQHEYNIKLMKNQFYTELQELQYSYQNRIDELHRRCDEMTLKIEKISINKADLEQKIPLKGNVKTDFREQNHKEKERHQQIQSLMLEKYSKYESQLGQLKRNNQLLILELGKANKLIRQLQQSVENSQKTLHHSTRHQQQQKNLISQSKIDNAYLLKTIEDFQQQNQALKKQIQLMTHATMENKSNPGTNNILIEDYQSRLNQERQQFNSERQQLIMKLQQNEAKLKQITEIYEKDKNDTQDKVKIAIQLYNKQIDTLKLNISHKSNQIKAICQHNQILKARLLRFTTSQLNESGELSELAEEINTLRINYANLQKNARALNEQLINKDSQMLQRDKSISAIQLQNASLLQNFSKMKHKIFEVETLKKQLEQIKSNLLHSLVTTQKINDDLDSKIIELENQLKNNKIIHDQQFSNLQKQMNQKQLYNQQQNNKIIDLQYQLKIKQQQNFEIKKIYEALNQQKLRFSYETLQQQLRELKKMVNQYYLKNNGKLQSQILQDYYRLNHQHELKIQQNLKLMKEIEELKEKFCLEERQKLLLNQKISLLNSNINIYEKQLKQRKLLYEQILQQKIKIEKEVLLSKKINSTRNRLDQSFKVGFGDITLRIDKLVEIERERTNKWHQYQQSE